MLVFSRKIGESIVVGGSISVLLVDMDRGKVRIGVHASRDIPVDRLEVREEKLKAGANESDVAVMLGKVVSEVARHCRILDMNHESIVEFVESVANKLSEYPPRQGWVESVVDKVFEKEVSK